MNSSKRTPHKNPKPALKKAARTLNEDYYINCQTTRSKASIPSDRPPLSKKKSSKLKLRSITQLTDSDPNFIYSNLGLKRSEPQLRGVQRLRSRTLVRGHKRVKSQIPGKEDLGVLYERVATTLGRYEEKLLMLGEQNRRLWEQNKRLRMHSNHRSSRR